MSVITEPSLKPPGAGLPALETFFLRRLYFPLSSRFTATHKALAAFEATTASIIDSVQALPYALQSKRVLIPRLTGIEDSSRNWSPLMVLEHLNLATRGITIIVSTLAAGQKPDIEVRIAEVKPKGILKEDGIEIFKEEMAQAAATLYKITEWNKAERLYHPWLGFLTAAQWIALLAMHQKLHKKQIDKILLLQKQAS